MFIRVNGKMYDVTIDKWSAESGRFNSDMVADMAGEWRRCDENGICIMSDDEFQEFTEYWEDEVDEMNETRQGLGEGEELILIVEER